MDTVQEEASHPPSPFYSNMASEPFLQPVPQFVVTTPDHQTIRRDSEQPESNLSSRRPSVIIAALRRPSQAIALSAAQAIMHQRRFIMGLFNESDDTGMHKRGEIDPKELERRRRNRRYGDDAFSIVLSALYAKLVVVLGMAFPITEIISFEVKPFFYQGFYLYLYIGSIAFVCYMYAGVVREKAVVDIINTYHKDKPDIMKKSSNVAPKYGSFYLRLGAIAFGVGSMVYSGLDFGRYFELKNNPNCDSNILQAITPATRMVLTLVQIQFIFLNSKDVHFNQHKTVARFGLMHMLATNLCEWLYVLVEETKHEIIHLGEHHNSSKSNLNEKYCQEGGEVMGSLVANSSPFLFPCTIEYSLICAVILFEIWKHITLEDEEENKKGAKASGTSMGQNRPADRVTTHFHFNPFGGRVVNSNHHFTIDCSSAHKGLFAGIMVIVLTIISLIMFFVLSTKAEKNKKIAIFEVSIVELVLYIITTIAVVVAMLKLRNFKYDRKIGKGHSGLGLDNTLLVVAQSGMFIYCMFSIIGSYFTMNYDTSVNMVAEIFSFIQTCLQTMFVLDGWWRRCRNIEQTKKKPGREIITFLIVANMAMWIINTLEKNRAEFRPTHLKFFGDWAWTVITHISMPMAIFYRFHSTICLFEIWKNAYKIKTSYKNPMFPVL